MTEQEEVFLQFLKLRMVYRHDLPYSTLSVLKFAAQAGNHHFFYNAGGVMKDYIAWANVSKEAIWKLENEQMFPLHDYEWNEGRIILIADILFESMSKFALRRFLNLSFPRCRLIVFFRKKRISMYCRYNGKFKLAKRST